MHGSPTKVDVVTLFVEDLEAATTFYEDVLGLDRVVQDADSAVFRLDNVLVNVLAVPAARDLVQPGGVSGPGAGSRFMLTVRVDDVDALSAELGRRGVVLLNGPVNRDWGVRTASFTDPAGHLWEIAQDLPPPTPGKHGAGS